jgi:Ca-activated chloride channel family protein
MMGLGVEAALEPAIEQGRHRYVFFLTDGYVGNESTIIGGAKQLVRAQAKRGQRARVFSFGVGSSTNRHLLEGIADAGDGVAVYASTRQDPAMAVNTFYRYIDHPILSDVQVDWHELRVSEVAPEVVPDLFASRPLVLQGRFEGHGKARVTVSGRVGGKLLELPIEVGLPAEDDNGVLATLWARARIESLEQRLAYGDGVASDLVADITQLGLDYRLVTKYTSFVAVDRSTEVDGEARTIVQPVETPEGVNAEMAGAGVISRMAASSGRGYGGALMQPAPMASPARAYKRKMSRRPRTTVAADGARRADAPAKIQVQGSISANTVETIIKGRLLEIQKILRGKKARVRFVIRADGTVANVEILGGVADAKLKRKLKQAIARWRFPAPSDGKRATVTYRF